MIPALTQTYSGAFFDFQDPEGTIRGVPLNDIAWALSNIPRFGGHAFKWSVLQHSLLVSYLCPLPLKLAGLVHDAHEALVGDIQTPLKQLLPDYKVLEDKVQAALLRRLNVPLEDVKAVKPYDLRALYLETRMVLPVTPAPEGPWACLAGQRSPSREENERFHKLLRSKDDAHLDEFRSTIIDNI